MMNNEELQQQVLYVLAGDLRLNSMLSQAPDAMLIPFMGNRDRFYALVSLCLASPGQDFEGIAYACLTTLRLIIGSGIANGLPGVEIALYISEDQKLRRILRLSVTANAFGSVIQLAQHDLLEEKPLDGITCGWYVQKPAL